jgi:hypothetical protein
MLTNLSPMYGHPQPSLWIYHGPAEKAMKRDPSFFQK